MLDLDNMTKEDFNEKFAELRDIAQDTIDLLVWDDPYIAPSLQKELNKILGEVNGQ